MSQPFDLDAVVGAPTEAFPFTWGGKTFELPRLLDLDVQRQLEIVDAIDGLNDTVPDAKQLLATLRLIVGDDLLAELTAAKPLSTRGIMLLLKAWMEFQGGAPGKSPDSPASSENTAAK